MTHIKDVIQQALNAYTDWENGVADTPVVGGKGLIDYGDMTYGQACRQVFIYLMRDRDGDFYWAVAKVPNTRGMCAHAMLLEAHAATTRLNGEIWAWSDQEAQAIAEGLEEEAASLRLWADVIDSGKFEEVL